MNAQLGKMESPKHLDAWIERMLIQNKQLQDIEQSLRGSIDSILGQEPPSASEIDKESEPSGRAEKISQVIGNINSTIGLIRNQADRLQTI